MPAVTYPQADGATWDDLEALIRSVASRPELAGVSLTDFVPVKDPGGVHAARLVEVVARALGNARSASDPKRARHRDRGRRDIARAGPPSDRERTRAGRVRVRRLTSTRRSQPPRLSVVATPLVIDCDPGVDDAIAILLALASPEVELLALTTVAGNLPLETTTATRCACSRSPDARTCRSQPGPRGP